MSIRSPLLNRVSPCRVLNIPWLVTNVSSYQETPYQTKDRRKKRTRSFFLVCLPKPKNKQEAPFLPQGQLCSARAPASAEGDIMASTSAQARLSVLSRQLADSSIARQGTKADDESVRPAPGGGRGTLTVIDNRTGKKYTVRIFPMEWCTGSGGK